MYVRLRLVKGERSFSLTKWNLNASKEASEKLGVRFFIN